MSGGRKLYDSARSEGDVGLRREARAGQVISLRSPIEEQRESSFDPRLDPLRRIAGRELGGAASAAMPSLFEAPRARSAQAAYATHLQRSVGNRATRALLGASRSGVTVQAKPLVVGPAQDAHEAEADRIAEQVVDGPSSLSSGASAPPRITPLVQRDAGEAETASGGFELSAAFQRDLAGTRGGGAPIDDATKTFMEARFGEDLSGVRIHTGDAAEHLSQQIGARAFTHGADIYMGKGQYQPGTRDGKRLLAHELTHVKQQEGTGALQPKRLIQRKEKGKKGDCPQQRAFLRNLYDRLFRFTERPIQQQTLESAKQLLASFQGEARAMADVGFEELLTLTERALESGFRSAQVRAQSLSEDDLETLKAYAKRDKHTKRVTTERDKVLALGSTVRDSSWYQGWGSRASLGWHKKALKRQARRSEAHNDAFNAITRTEDKKFLGYSVTDSFLRTVIEAETNKYFAPSARQSPHDLFTSLVADYGGPDSSFSNVLRDLVGRSQVFREIIELYESFSLKPFES